MKRQDFFELLDSWENIHILIQYLIDYPKQIDDLIDIGLNDPIEKSWRAIWLADKIHEKRPELIRPYVPKLISALKKTKSEGKKRHMLKLISLNPIPGKDLSFLFKYCLNEFTSAEMPVAIRVHSMQILYEISEIEPELKPELIQLIEHEMTFHSTAGIKSRGKKLLKKLYSQSERDHSD